eukprot:scaffold184284_cov35-Tisochrysis_lutea.AAC.2
MSEARPELPEEDTLKHTYSMRMGFQVLSEFYSRLNPPLPIVNDAVPDAGGRLRRRLSSRA